MSVTINFTAAGGGGGGGGGAVSSVNGHTGAVVLGASDVGAQGVATQWNAATNTPTLTSGTAQLGAVYENSTAGITTLGTPIDGITTVQFGDTLVCLAAGTYTLVPNSTIVGPFANTTALQSAWPAATTTTIGFAWVGAAAPYALYYNNQSAWTVFPTGGTGTTIDLYGGNSFFVAPSGTGASTWTTLGTSTALATVGTATARSGQLASIGYIGRVGYVSTAAANNNAYVSTSSSALQTTAPSTSSTFPTQRARVVWCATDAQTASRTGAGFISSTPTATAEPSTLVNNAWFAADSTDTQLTLMTCAGTGTATKTVLNGGTGFPANTNGADIYEGYLEFVGGATRTLNYFIINLVTGVKASGSVTATLPDAGTNLRVGAYRNTAANTGAASIDVVCFSGGGFAQMGPTS